MDPASRTTSRGPSSRHRGPAATDRERRLVDDRLHDGKVFLDLRLAQETPGDTFEVVVEWADDNAGNRVVEDYTVTCRDLDPEPACETDTFQGTTNPTNPDWSAVPLMRLPVDQDFLPSVTMKVTNSYGGTVSQAFPITGEHRAQYADRTPYVQMEVGHDYGSTDVIDVTTVSPSDLIPGASIDIEPFVNEIEAQLPEGAKVDQRDDGSGGTILELWRRRPATSVCTRQATRCSRPFRRVTRCWPPAMRPAAASVTPTWSRAPPRVPSARSSRRWSRTSDRSPRRLPGRRHPGALPDPLGDDPADDPTYQGGVLCSSRRAARPCSPSRARSTRLPLAGRPARRGLEGDGRGAVVQPRETIDPDPYEITFSTRLLKPTLTVHPAPATAPTQRVSLAIEDFNPFTGPRTHTTVHRLHR